MPRRLKKRRFSPIERWVVFTIHGEKCYLDDHPIDLQSMQIDHIIPEFLLTQPEKLFEVLRQFGLPQTFDLNSYANWMPACGRHNNRKRCRVFEPTPLIQIHLQAAAEKMARAMEIEKKTVSNREIAAALNVLERAAFDGDIEPELRKTFEDAFATVRRRALMDKVEELKIPITLGFGGSDGGSAYACLFREIMCAPIRLTPTLVLKPTGFY